MACLLLVDGSDLARRALHGILARAGHRLAAVGTVPEAWKFVTEHVRVDLVITELQVPGGGGLALIQRIKNDTFLKLLPVVIYAASADRATVKRALALRVQNLLIKPYHDDVLYAEIAKAEANPWRNRHFEEEKSFCRQMGYQPAELHERLSRLRGQLAEDRPVLERNAAAGAVGAIQERLTARSAQAETAGAWGLVDYLAELGGLAERGEWSGFMEKLGGSGVADWLIARHLDPSFMPEPFLTAQERDGAREEQARARWLRAPQENRCPVVDFAQLREEVAGLSGCPVMESAAAAYEMTATGHPSSLHPLMDLVARDTGLATQMLITASQLRRQEDFDPSPLEDPRLAVGRLGEVRLAALARQLVTVEERHMHLPPQFSWAEYWMFQMGVARVARFTCHYLELYSLELQARMGGLLHDLGKLLLVRLHPFALQATVAHARDHRVPLPAAERYFLGGTTQELAAHFAAQHNLAPAYQDVLRWLDRPEEAPEHRELVAVVSLARDLCRQYHLGFNGDPVLTEAIPLEDTAEWRVLRERVFPSFDLGKFGQQVQAECRGLRIELQGRAQGPAAS